jgi:hypothetical protein
VSWKPEDEVQSLPDVLSRTLDGEAVLLDLRTGTYFGLNEVGTTAWELLRAGTTVGKMVEAVVARFEVERGTAESDLHELLDALLERGLVRRPGESEERAEGR